MAFADAIFEEGAEGGEFARDGTFLQAVVVQVADEFSDSVVRDGGESGWLEAGGGEIVEELGEVFAVVGNGVRRGVLYGAKILEIFGDGCLHSGDAAPSYFLYIIDSPSQRGGQNSHKTFR